MEQLATPKCWQDFADVMSAGIDRVILYGPPGTGKTHAGLYQGVKNNAPAYRLVCSEEMTSASVEGTWKPNGDRWQFAEGPAVRAWRAGGRLVVDEGDKASGDVLGVLLNFLDSVESASWENPDTGEIVTPGAGFSAVITSNIEDPDYLPPALADRFPVKLEINAPHPLALARLPQHLRGVANAVISAEPERRVSLRAFYAYDLLTRSMTTERASELVFGKGRAEAIHDALAVGSL